MVNRSANSMRNHFISYGVNHDTRDMCTCRNYHICSGVLNMLRYDKHTTIKLTSVTTLTAASVFSDSIFNYYITIPIVVTFVVHVLINKDFSKWRYVFAVIVGVVIAKFLALVANYFGLLNTPGLNLQHLLITRIYHLTSIFSLLASSSISTPSFSENSFLQAMR